MNGSLFLDEGCQKRCAETVYAREGANREKLTVKKIINNEIFFFTVYVPYKLWKIGVNREKIGTKPWKNRHQKSTIFHR